MSRVVHFEIHADDPLRAATFYRSVFGWTIEQVPGMEYWLATTGPDGEPGINGAILPRRGDRPPVGAAVVGMVNTVQVGDLDATLALVTAHGGGLALDKMPVPGVGTLAYVHDTEANIVGVLQPEG